MCEKASLVCNILLESYQVSAEAPIVRGINGSMVLLTLWFQPHDNKTY